MPSSWALSLKYFLDRLLAGLGLVALAPLFLLIALAVKFGDRGPVFFLHPRPGWREQPYRVWKFRTMVVDADKLLDDRGRVTGSRVTRVGKLLRFTSLDELPQLINILRGEMSLVGPRPAIMEHLPRYTPEQRERFRMKPGITGLAQVSGRNQLRWSERIRLDNEYIDDWSLALDLKILLRTLRVVLLREGVALDRNPEQVDDLAPAPQSAEPTESEDHPR